MTAPHPMNDFVLDELWDTLKARLDTPTMREICNPTGDGYGETPCVYVAGIDDFEEPEGVEGEDWGRVVIVPTDTLWPVAEVEGETRKLGFLLRTEFNNYRAEGYRPNRGLDLAQQEGHRRLQRWTPTGFTALLVAFAFYRFRAPQPVPERDDGRGLLVKSSEYRFEASGAP